MKPMKKKDYACPICIEHQKQAKQRRETRALLNRRRVPDPMRGFRA